MIQILTEYQWDQRAKTIFSSIFLTDHPTPYEPGLKSNKNLSERLILYGFTYSLTESKYSDQFIESLQSVEETGFFVSLTEAPRNQINIGGNFVHDWYVPFEEIKNFEMIPLENIAFSERGEWAILFSQENHAVFTCTSELLTELKKRIPGLHDQVYDFLILWKKYHLHYGLDYPWIQQLLHHIYGEQKGRKLLSFIRSTFRISKKFLATTLLSGCRNEMFRADAGASVRGKTYLFVELKPRTNNTITKVVPRRNRMASGGISVVSNSLMRIKKIIIPRLISARTRSLFGSLSIFEGVKGIHLYGILLPH